MRKIIIIILFVITLFFSSLGCVCASDEILKTETSDKVIFIKDNNGSFEYSWTFEKKKLKEDNFDFDMEIESKSKKLYDIDKLFGDNSKKKLFSFKYHGALPGTSTIKIFVSDVFKDGSSLSLYSYDEDKEKIEQIQKNIKVINGYISFDIDYCLDYFVSLSSNNIFDKEKNSGVVIIGMIVVIVGLVGYIIFKNQ